LASARPPRSARHIYRFLGLDTLQINYNGAMIWNEPASRIEYHEPLTTAVAQALMEQARAWFPEILVSCEVLDRWITDRVDPKYLTETARLFPPDAICPISQMCQQPVTKMLFMGATDIITQLLTNLNELRPQVAIVRSDPDLIQIMHPRVSKATALQSVAAHYGVPMEQVMAIGDAANDIPMLQAAGVSIAMDNASDHVKQIAHWIAPSNNDHGVHAALRRYGLCT
jgi:Cof subfamily protein (haloacid dehalogenase superfamily)